MDSHIVMVIAKIWYVIARIWRDLAVSEAQLQKYSRKEHFEEETILNRRN